jgi:hypothetical protein
MLIRAAARPIEVFSASAWHVSGHGCHDKSAIGRNARLRLLEHVTIARSANFLHESQENRIAHFIDPMLSASTLQTRSQLGDCHQSRSDDVSMSAEYAQVSHGQVFVLDLGRHPAFAFATGDVEQAQGIVRSSWLLRALDAFCKRRPLGGGRLQLRPATEAEAAIYRDRADEFAEDVIFSFPIVHIGAD